jgi:hypothetical protein
MTAKPRKPTRRVPTVRPMYSPITRCWYLVRGPHATPIGGAFGSREEALRHLERDRV